MSHGEGCISYPNLTFRPQSLTELSSLSYQFPLLFALDPQRKKGKASLTEILLVSAGVLCGLVTAIIAHLVRIKRKRHGKRKLLSFFAFVVVVVQCCCYRYSYKFFDTSTVSPPAFRYKVKPVKRECIVTLTHRVESLTIRGGGGGDRGDCALGQAERSCCSRTFQL